MVAPRSGVCTTSTLAPWAAANSSETVSPHWSERARIRGRCPHRRPPGDAMRIGVRRRCAARGRRGRAGAGSRSDHLWANRARVNRRARRGRSACRQRFRSDRRTGRRGPPVRRRPVRSARPGGVDCPENGAASGRITHSEFDKVIKDDGGGDQSTPLHR